MNYWSWLNIIIVPILIFAVKPNSPNWLRIIRIIIAIGISYVLLNISLNFKSSAEWDAIESYRNSHSICYTQQCEEEPKPTVTGSSLAFMLVFGWIPALAYVGLLELIWRLFHYKTVKNYSEPYKGKWFSNIIIFLSLLFMILAAIYTGTVPISIYFHL